jgi:hypothetical protein
MTACILLLIIGFIAAVVGFIGMLDPNGRCRWCVMVFLGGLVIVIAAAVATLVLWLRQ